MKPTQPLRVSVEDGQLVMRIGIETLQFCTLPKNGGKLEGCRVDLRRRAEFAKDVGDAMTGEDEIGNSRLTEFLDEMIQAAADAGSGALIYPKTKRKKKTR